MEYGSGSVSKDSSQELLGSTQLHPKCVLLPYTICMNGDVGIHHVNDSLNINFVLDSTAKGLFSSYYFFKCAWDQSAVTGDHLWQLQTTNLINGGRQSIYVMIEFLGHTAKVTILPTIIIVHLKNIMWDQSTVIGESDLLQYRYGQSGGKTMEGDHLYPVY